MRIPSVLILTMLAAGVAVVSVPHSSQRAEASRAFTCVLPITVSVSGRPVATTPTVCVPTP